MATEKHGLTKKALVGVIVFLLVVCVVQYKRIQRYKDVMRTAAVTMNDCAWKLIDCAHYKATVEGDSAMMRELDEFLRQWEGQDD